jgi:polar amino acid transport system substrate-binding protein
MRSAWAVVFAAAALLTTAAAHAETITIVGDPWCPYNCEATGERPGFGIEIAREVFGPAGIEVAYRNVSWDDAIAKTRTGVFTAVIGASKEDAPDFVFPARAIGSSNNIVVVRAGDPWKYAGPGSLLGRRIGAIKAYSYGEELDAWFAKHPPEVSVEGEDPKALLMKKLIGKQIDVFIEDTAVMADFVKSSGALGLVSVAGNADDPTPVHIAFSPANKKSAGYARQLAEGIDRLEKSGRLREILAKYGVK